MRIVVGVLPMAGHVGPLTGLVAALVRRGHEVRVYTGSRYQRRFADLGATPLPWRAARDFDETAIAATFPRAGRPGPLGPAAFAEDAMVRTGPGQVADLTAALRDEPADLLVGDVFAIGIGLVGELLELPWAGVCALPPNFLSEDLPPPGLQVPVARGPIGRHRDQMLRRAFRLAMTGMDRAYRRSRSDIGLPPARSGFMTEFYSPWLVLATGAPSMELPRTDLPPAVHFVGRLAPANGVAGAPFVRATDRPLVIVTQGTHNVDPRDLLRPAARGLADVDAEIVLTTGRSGVRRIGAPVPANARVVDFLDFSAALPQTAVLITNGGWGTVLEAAAASVPMLIAGGDIDKPENAVRVARARAGIDLRTGHPSPRTVADGLARLLSEPTWRAGAARLGGELHRLGGIERSIELLEELALTGRPVRRATDPWTGRPS